MHISFDFDYTLADSSGGSVACADYALRELGLASVPPARIRRTIGLSLERTFAELTGESVESPDAASFREFFLEHAERVMLSHIRMYPGTVPVLESLRSHGYLISIVSTKRKERIYEAMARDGLTGLVDLVVGGGCVKNYKPHPEALLRAVGELRASLEDTIYVGDSVSDGECALRAGTRFLGLTSGQTSEVDLAKWAPVAVLSRVDQVPEFLSGISDTRHMI